MTPLKVTWEFASPVAARVFPLHFDALLAFAKVNRAEMLGIENPYAEQEALPLEKAGGIWKASQIVFTPAHGPVLVPFVRRFSMSDFTEDSGLRYEEGKKNIISNSSGRYKGFDLRIHVQPMKYATAWCVGSRQEIEDLLKDITSLGKYHQKGQGSIKRVNQSLAVKVDECPPEEAEHWRLRVLPEGSGLELPGIKYVPVMAVCTAPYWDRSRQQKAILPVLP